MSPVSLAGALRLHGECTKQMSPRRRRATRAQTAVQYRYGRALHPVPRILRGRLLDGRLRSTTIQEGVVGVDFMLVGCEHEVFATSFR